MTAQIWIDIEDASGQKYGDGPITTATGWTSTRRLDAAGKFAFTMPAADPRANLLVNKRIVRCWTVERGVLKELGAGIIDAITLSKNGDGITMLSVSGDDMLRELTNRTVGNLALHRTVSYVPELWYYYNDENGQPQSTPLALPATVDLRPEGDFLYVRYPRQFKSVTFTLSAVNSVQTNTFNIQYLNSDDNGPAWEALPGLSDGLAVTGTNGRITPFAQSDVVSFDPPTGWIVDDSRNLYSVRFFDPVTDLGSFTVTAVTVQIEESVSDGLQRIMALAPNGWTLDGSSGYYRTVDANGNGVSVYMDFAGESVLSALIALAEQTGNHFTLSPAYRRVRWLGMANSSSGLRAIQAAETTDSTMLIASMERTIDSYELYNRVYPHGSGTGSSRVTLANLSTSVPAGFVCNLTDNYIEHTASIATYGRIDQMIDYPDITADDASLPQLVNASNALFTRAYHDLRRKCTLQSAYTMTLVPSRYEVWPGQTIIVKYDEWADWYHAVAINETLYILEVQQQVGNEGPRTVALTVATVDYWPDNDARAYARIVRSLRNLAGTDTPATAQTTVAAGVPTQLSVSGGQITSIARVVPVADGVYPVEGNKAIKRLRIRSGQIVEIQTYDLPEDAIEPEIVETDTEE